MKLSYLSKVGRYQWLCIFVYALTCGISVNTNTSILLVAPKIDFHCDDPSDTFQKLTYEEQKKIITVFGRCNRPDVNFTAFTVDQLVDANLTSYSKPRPCDTGFVYDHQDYDYTVTEQYALVCDRKWLISMSKSVFMLGFFIGAVGSGALSDRFGRKTVALSTCIAVAITNMLSAFSPNVEVFLLARCLVGAVGIAFYTTGLILTTELVRKDERKIPRTVLSISISAFVIVFVGVSYGLRDHRYLQTYTSCCLALASVVIWYVLPESPRWLTAHERHEEAAEVVERIARNNKWSKEKLDHLLIRETKSDNLERKPNLTDLFRTPVLRKRIIALCVVWFMHVMTFYAILYNMGSFYPDLRLSLLISQSIEMVFFVIPIFLVDLVGRQVLTFSFMFAAGIFCLGMTALMQHGGSTALLVLAVCGKVAVVSQFFVSYIYTQELMPTVVRSQGLGLASTVSRIGGMLAPQIALLDDLWPASSVLILGLCAFIGSFTVLLLPDTTGVELNQSIADGEHFKPRHIYRFDLPKAGREKIRKLRHRKDATDDETETESVSVGQSESKSETI